MKPPASPPRTDSELEALVGEDIASETLPDTGYRLERVIGRGATGVVFFALRVQEGRFSPVVMKMIRPSVLEKNGDVARLMVRKEAVALGRLNEQVPPTPFVVRVMDVGELGNGQQGVPWIVLEYVHGGYEGTTLSERVDFCCGVTGKSFDVDRARLAIRSIAKGLGALAKVGVVHRDVTPGNVLCCGFGESEIFKIADFGLSRTLGMPATFVERTIGTPGYTAPEQAFPDLGAVGQHTDVFGLACVAFFILTGEHYFAVTNSAHLIALVRAPDRRPLAHAPGLSPGLAARPDACERLDRVLALATSERPSLRPQTAQGCADLMLVALGDLRGEGRYHEVDSGTFDGGSNPGSHRWFIRHRSDHERRIISLAWDGDSRALVASDNGLRFWSGTDWLRVGFEPMELSRPQLVRRLGAGSFLIGDGGSFLVVFGLKGHEYTTQCPDEGARIVDASGSPRDQALVAGVGSDGLATVWTVSRGHWSQPIRLPGVVSVNTLARLEPGAWLVCGRDEAERGFALVFESMSQTLRRLEVPDTPAFLASASQPERRAAFAAGRDGAVIRVRKGEASGGRVAGGPALSACALDVSGREWVAGSGSIWTRGPEDGAAWERGFHDAESSAPFIAMQADVGHVVAMSALGAIVEARVV